MRKDLYWDATATVTVVARQTINHNFSLIPSTSSLKVSPEALEFQTGKTNVGLDIINEGRGQLEWKITLPANTSWLSADKLNGMLQPSGQRGDKTSVVVSVNRSSLQPDDYEDNLIVTYADGGHVDVRVTMAVVGLPQLTVGTARDVTRHTAVVTGSIGTLGDKNGVADHGFVYSFTHSEPIVGNDPYKDLGSRQTAGTFTANLTSLRAGKKSVSSRRRLRSQ